MNETFGVWFIAAVIAAIGLGALAGYFFRDNRRLRGIIEHIDDEKKKMAADLRETQLKLQTALDQQGALVSVLKFVMQGEIRTARNDEREAIFATALTQLKAIERDIIINNNPGEGGAFFNRSNVDVAGDMAAGDKNTGSNAGPSL